MEDFLKDRPVLDPKSALVVAGDPGKAAPAVKHAAPPAPAVSGPFADLRSGGPVAAVRTAGKPGAPSEPVAAAPQALRGEHGTKVQTVVERGRVTKIIVTCTCGKVTEIACQY